jgi:hypothetical protein
MQVAPVQNIQGNRMPALQHCLHDPGVLFQTGRPAGDQME